MEWVRSAYTSGWRLFRNSAGIKVGRFVFVDNDTPFYPAPHNFFSADWTTDEGIEPNSLGEVPGFPRIYYIGDPPTLRAQPFLLGNQDCIENGDDVNAPAFPTQFGGGWDSRCPFFP